MIREQKTGKAHKTMERDQVKKDQPEKKPSLILHTWGTCRFKFVGTPREGGGKRKGTGRGEEKKGKRTKDKRRKHDAPRYRTKLQEHPGGKTQEKEERRQKKRRKEAGHITKKERKNET